MAKYYPINLALENKRCLVIGAGKIAERKTRRLLECGARVSVVGQAITPGLKALWKKKKIIFKKRKFNFSDLSGACLVIAATSDREMNSAISSYCLKNGILINVVDSPKECSFILPSVVRKGDLTISISTNGISPALSRKIRVDLERRFGTGYSGFLRAMKRLRPRALKEIKDVRKRKSFFKKAMKEWGILKNAA